MPNPNAVYNQDQVNNNGYMNPERVNQCNDEECEECINEIDQNDED